MININKDRLINEFIELVKIDSLSLKERQMADILVFKLKNIDIKTDEDKTGEKIGGNAGNLICKFEGEKSVPSILLMAHMDTVSPGTSKKAVIDGDVIKSDGTTVLGGDDVAGIVVILEVLRAIKENNINHGDIYVAFTVAEEVGLLGAKELDVKKIEVKYCFVCDLGGEIGSVSVAAPSHYNMNIKIKGKAAHAGVEPENGISAIEIASHAISSMKLGRIDYETTANVGIINGGNATNIVCDLVEIKAEARSRNKEKLELQIENLKKCFEDSCKKFGGSLEFKGDLEYTAYNISEDCQIINILKKAAEKAEVQLNLIATGGGSDTNIINAKGVESVNISVGMDKVHSVQEQISINNLLKAARFLLEIIDSIY